MYENRMYFVFIYENRRMKPVKIVLVEQRNNGEGKSSYVSTYENITMYPCEQLLYASKV
jgi:hypothetical protein